MAAHHDGTILSWGTNYGWFTPPAGGVTGMVFHPAGERVTAGDADGGLYTWDVACGEQFGVPEHVEGGVFAFQYAKDGTRYTASGTPPSPGPHRGAHPPTRSARTTGSRSGTPEPSPNTPNST